MPVYRGERLGQRAQLAPAEIRQPVACSTQWLFRFV
jgi:hypothetical protein